MMPLSLQQRLFDMILARYPQKTEAVADLQQILNLSKDPVYRRLRCETFLLPEELVTLATHYHISLDALIHLSSNNVLCNFNAFTRRVKDFTDYLEHFIADLEQIRRLPDAHFYYASVEIPVLTYNFLPELISFKLYVWGRTTWNLEFLHNRPFDFDLITPPVIRLSQQLLQQYLSLHSTELWSVNIVDNTLAQIEYHAESGGFRHRSDALLLCDKIIEWAQHMKAIAAAGKKFRIGEKPEHGLGELKLYHNEMIHTNNAALITSKAGKLVYSSYCNPNFIMSTDPRLCDYTEDWFQRVMAKSQIISAASEKGRDLFFQIIQRKVERVKQRIAAKLEDHD
jgi:hypothetical protein